MSKLLILGAALYATMATSSFSESVKLGDLLITDPVLRATPPSAKVGAGYLTITNNGALADRLVGGQSQIAGKLEIHEMKMENQVMKMKPLENGLEIPAGATVKLLPGGNHLMFMQLKQSLQKGAEHRAILQFENAGQKELTFVVKSIADTIKMKHSH